MTTTNDPMFEQRLGDLMRGVLDAENGPHPHWVDSPAARRIAGGDANVRRLPPLRLLALAAVLVVGGAVAAVGASRLLDQTQRPQPTLPVVALPTQIAKPTLPALPTQIAQPTPTSAPASPSPDPSDMSRGIAYMRLGSIVLRSMSNDREKTVPGFNACPKFLENGRLTYASADVELAAAGKWRIDSLSYDPVTFEYRSIDTLAEIDQPLGCFDPSPDGTHFAYVSPESAGGGVHVVDNEGETIDIDLPEDPAPLNVRDLAWSPDGEYLAIVRTIVSLAAQSFYSEVWLWDADDGTVRLALQREPGHPVEAISWSPSGHVLGFGGTIIDCCPAASFERVGYYVRTIDVDDPDAEPTAIDELIDPSRLMAGALMAGGPAWSPDGSSLAWVMGGELRVGKADGSDRRGMQLLSYSDLGIGWAILPLVWSPDSGQVLVGQINSPDPENVYRFALVLYDVHAVGQPQFIEQWTDGSFGGVVVTWDGGSQ